MKVEYNKESNIVSIECDLNQTSYLLAWFNFIGPHLEKGYQHHLAMYNEWRSALKHIEIEVDKDATK